MNKSENISHDMVALKTPLTRISSPKQHTEQKIMMVFITCLFSSVRHVNDRTSGLNTISP